MDISKALIVDDMHINRIILSSLLASEGVMSDQASTGMECVELCRRNEYSLILLDHRMPDMDGVDTLLELKKVFEEKRKSVPVICHTIEEGRKNINLYRAAGFTDVLIKPVDPKELAGIVLKYIPDNDKNEHLKLENKEKKETHEKDELDKLPIWLKTVPHIDLVSGIDKCETADDYMDALYIFVSSIEKKSSDIESLCENDKLELYGIKLHSLKSVAGLIGARHLSAFASELELAAREKNRLFIKHETPLILKEYRSFKELLAPLLVSEPGRISGLNEKLRKKKEAPDISHNILFIRNADNIVTRGLTKALGDSGYNIIDVPDEPAGIITRKHMADIILYCPGGSDSSGIRMTMNFLDELFRDEDKMVCLAGDSADINDALSASAVKTPFVYPRPVDNEKFIQDMGHIVRMQKELKCRKKIYITDDDEDYRAIVEKWLSDDHSVNGFSNTSDTLAAIGTLRPDLLLLDYELPDGNGYELMKQLHASPATANIPVIFLTGKNDREHVYKILGCRPDGYLLKNIEKDVLLSAIRKFFRERIYDFL